MALHSLSIYFGHLLTCWDLSHPTCLEGARLLPSGSIHVWFVPLSKDLPDLPSQPVIHESAAPSDEELIPLRLMAYQAHQPAKWKDLRKHPTKHFLSILPTGMHLRAYGWREVTVDNQVAMLGYAKIPPGKKDELLNKSGKGGWFIEPLRCHISTKKPVLWINKQNDEPPDVYFCRVLALGAQKSLPMACRRGGGSNLGLRGAVVDADQATKWIAESVPANWQPTTFTQFLTQQKWKDVKHVTPPRSFRGKLTFAAVLPDGAPKDFPWICKVGDTTINVNKWKRSKPVYSEQRLTGFSRWYHVP